MRSIATRTVDLPESTEPLARTIHIVFDLPEYLKLVAGLASIVNPVGVIPIFLSLTEGQGSSQRRLIAFQSSIALSIVLLVALVAGEAILSFLALAYRPSESQAAY